MRLLWAVVVASLAACIRTGFDSTPAYDHVWVVNLGEDRQAGPADLPNPNQVPDQSRSLSLREALLLASASAGSDQIVFDDAAFTASSGTTLHLREPLPALRDRAITIENDGPAIILDGAGLASGCASIIANDAVIRGLTFQDCGDPALLVDGAQGALIAGNRFSGTRGVSLRLVGSVDVAVQDNLFDRGSGDLISAEDATALRIERNLLTLSDKESNRGIYLTRVSGSLIADNFLDPGSAWMIGLDSSSDNRIERNLIDGAHSGIVLVGDSDRNFIFRNIVVNVVYDGIYLEGGANQNTVVHNTVSHYSSLVADDAADNVVKNNLGADDGFVDPARYDFRLVEGNPAIDTGEDLGYDLLPAAPENFLGAAPDLGAVESG